MKYLVSLLALLGCIHALPAQSMLEDAKTLRTYFNPPNAEESRVSLKRDIVVDERASAIFQKYMAEGNTLSEMGQLVETFKGKPVGKGINAKYPDRNPFIRIEDENQNLEILKSTTNPGGGGNGPSPAGSGFSVSNLADGLARFLVKRTKQELSMAFFNEFKEKIATDPYLGNFCPLTKAQLDRVDTEVYQFNDYLESLREAFTADMTALPGSTERYLRDASLCPDCLTKPEGKIITDFFHIGQQMVNGEPPIDMIAYLALPENGSAIQTADSTAPKLYNMAGGLRFLNLVSESFRKTDSIEINKSQMPWYSAREIREAFKDPVVLEIYLGLLWQKAKNIAFVDDSGARIGTMGNLMQTANTGVGLVQNWRRSIESFGDLTQSLQFSMRSSAGTRTTVADDFFSYSQSITDLLQEVNQTGRTMLGQTARELIPSEYILMVRQCNALYFNVRQRNFAGAVGNVIYCLNLLNKHESEKAQKQLEAANSKLKMAHTEAEKAEAEKAKEAAQAQAKKADKTQKSITTLLKYANFMAAIAEANSPEEMERAIELFALPPGSSSMKKQPGRVSIALNAYTGFALGAEYLQDEHKPGFITAFTAPVGVSCSWGVKKFGSLGFFVPLIDVGAVTTYRFNDKNTEDLPELTWGNILSPGLYFVYGLPKKLPLSIGYGAQIGPSLRKVTANGADNKSAWRHGFFATVDIPITYFYLSKNRK